MSDPVMHAPRLVIAGTHSGVGKTTVTLGLMAALAQRGLAVQGYKAGPDYIDPSYHTALTGRISRNLDSWMLSPDTLIEVFLRANRDADVSLIEGVMGLYDGKAPLSDAGSTAEISRLLAAPVLLVIDVAGAARSAAAMVKGFQALDPRVRIAGVIANRTGGEGHYRLVKAAVEQACGVPVVGYLKGDANIHLPERHLGLVPAIEHGRRDALLQQLSAAVSSTVNLDAVLDLARHAVDIDVALAPVSAGVKRAVIAVAKDAAFNFYYPENLELLERCGAKLVEFSPVAGEKVPDDADGLYIGGGFPEEFAQALSRHRAVREHLRQLIERGLPTYAECGGYMYLARSITTHSGDVHEMVGLLPAQVRMQAQFAGFGYREVRGAPGNWLLASEESARGHAFHYSTMTFDEPHADAYNLTAGASSDTGEGALTPNLVAGYTHLHFASNPQIAQRFVDACAAYRTRITACTR